ncbi:MAG: NADH-quinone oxidoreductase subunit C, partial [Desulfobulbaceae bacterium]|nr:NADH-quinone oxidoreductase subunit C [Desulfobulbaceae bacterium]
SETDHAKKGYDLDVQVAAEQVTAVAAAIREAGFFIEAVTGVDWLGEQAALAAEAAKAKEAAAKKAAEAAAAAAAEAGAEAAPAPPPAPEPPAAAPLPDEMEVVYDFAHYQENCRVVVRTRIPRDTPELPTISAIYPGANWHERETHDFFGIRFLGHPDLTPLLLPEDADFHPLLKDFKA